MHPDCDELLHIIESKIELEILPLEAGESTVSVVPVGAFVVVPQGCWHRQRLLDRTKEYYLTPGQTLHSHAEDPRLLTDN